MFVVICWKISIFAPAKTTTNYGFHNTNMLWFAEKLVSLHQQKQLIGQTSHVRTVVICWKISIFAPAKTTRSHHRIIAYMLWFAEKLVSLHQQKQQIYRIHQFYKVVICWKISIFAPAKTTFVWFLWFHNCCDLLKN